LELGAWSEERRNNMNETFRFQNLQVWQRAAHASIELFKLAEEIEEQKHYRWAEQLRSATLSITNNIAEGSGSSSKSEFAQFLNYSRRSVYEVANMLIILKNEFQVSEQAHNLLAELEEISRMISAFRKTLL
jgi:four helix bundle protein